MGIAYFCKKNLDIKIKQINKKDNKLYTQGIVAQKSTVDYYGVYKGRYISFEAKSTNTDKLPIANIKQHQHNHLLLIKKLGGLAFYIIYFKNHNKIFMIDVDKMDIKKASLTINEAFVIGQEISICFPGIIDFLEFL